jgi:hypothetical protein
MWYADPAAGGANIGSRAPPRLLLGGRFSPETKQRVKQPPVLVRHRGANLEELTYDERRMLLLALRGKVKLYRRGHVPG